MGLSIQGIPTEVHDQLRKGGGDAHGQPALARTAQGGANPCRHCLGLIAEGETKLVLAYRPFVSPLHPYAETGPIFVHQSACSRYEADTLPAWFAWLDPAMVRGYGSDDWIRYETGQVVRGADLASVCETILTDSDIAYVHIRSKFGCFQCRVDRT